MVLLVFSLIMPIIACTVVPCVSTTVSYYVWRSLRRSGDCYCDNHCYYRDEALGALKGDQCVVRLGSSSGGVDDNVDRVVEDRVEAGLIDHDLDVTRAKDCLQRLECQP